MASLDDVVLSVFVQMVAGNGFCEYASKASQSSIIDSYRLKKLSDVVDLSCINGMDGLGSKSDQSTF